MKCKYCGNDNSNMFDNGDYEIVCLNCGAMDRKFVAEFTSFDCMRINMRKKPVYDQVSYFEKCMRQYQGKQNTEIPDKLLFDLQNKFKDGNIDVTRDKIIRFLKELQYKKQLKNVNLIYFELTQKHIDDISHLEYALLEDLKTLMTLLDEQAYIEDGSIKDTWRSLNRKNFLNIPSLLFQLLRNRNHPCEMSNFNILKTSNSIKFHNDVSCNLFEKLGWNFTPIDAIR